VSGNALNSAGSAFEHRFVPAAGEEPRTLLLLHGTGGNEDDLVPLGETLLPGAAMLSPRGQVLEHGMPRFFRRLAEGVFDLDDLRARTAGLADFVGWAAGEYGFDPGQVIAAGFSNGANIAASLLLLRPGTLAGAILFRAMVPLTPETPPALAGVRVLIGAGRSDPLVHPAEVERLAAMLTTAGADVSVHWTPGGHQLTPGDVAAARAWLAGEAAT
jgi:phospholipase/carboxylesterase/glyoxalase family protein